ncbi:MAG: hypothetical protein ACKVQA_26115, partial [Burkholderiales bacterium]
MATDPRLKDRKSLIEKFRKVIPPTLGESAAIAQQRSATRSATVTTGLEPFTGEWNEATVNHLLRRTLFGVTKANSIQFQQLSVGASVDLLLAEVSAPAPPVNNYNGINGVVDPTAAFGDTFVTAPYSNQHEGYRITSLKGWWLKNILNQSS